MSRALKELEQDERFGEFICQSPIHDKNPNGVLNGNEDTEQYPTPIIATFKLLLNAGFQHHNVRVTDRVNVVEFSSVAEIEKFVAGINLHRNLIPVSLQQQFDVAMANEIRRTPYFIGEDRLTMLSPAIEIHAYKEKEKKNKKEDASEESFVE
jgi:hypothetical protein